MKSFDVYSRYGTKYKAILVDENTIHFFADNANYVSHGGSATNPYLLGYIDPEGGPFIALFETPAHCIHKDLPDREIIDISIDDGHYVIKLQEAKEEKKPIKRKTKVKEQKILKKSKHIRN